MGSATVGDFLLRRLSQWGIKRVFGCPGDGINGVIAAFERADEQLEFIQVRHEEMAAFMACPHAKFTGEVGVCLATSGPGAIHLLNGLYDAQLDHPPVLAIVGQQSLSSLGGSYQQEIDLISLFKDVAGEYVHMASSPEQVRHLVDRAVRIAKAERTVTCIILPNDLQEMEAVEEIPHAHGTIQYRAIPLQAPYCGAKFAIRGFTDSLRSELLHDRLDIHLTMVQMPALNTPQFDWGRNKLPRRPQPMPPIFQPEVAARAIVFAASAGRREVWVGASTIKAILGTRIAPGFIDRYLARRGYTGQLSGEAADPQAPDNLFTPLPGDHGAHGRFGTRAASKSRALWASMHKSALLSGAGSRSGGDSRSRCDGVGCAWEALRSRISRRCRLRHRRVCSGWQRGTKKSVVSQ